MKKLIKQISNRWLFTLLLVAGMMFTSDMNAQSAATFTARIAQLTTMQQTYAPGSAKYDLVDQAVNYITWVQNNLATNPNFMDTTGASWQQADQLRKVHPTILKNYTAAELAAFQGQYNTMVTAGDTSNPQFKKVQWIMDANAY